MFQARILLVDDEPDFHLLFRDMLRVKPWHIDAVQNGQDALKRLEDNPFDVVILDLYMPGLSGVEVLQKIQNKGIRVDVILMTGFGKIEGTLEKTMLAGKYGAVGIIEKPFNKTKFIEVIENLLRQRNLSTYHLTMQMDAYIKEHAFNPEFKIDTLSKFFSITPRYIAKLFRRHIETTFQNRLTFYRVQKAKRLIESTDLPLYDIAEQCGFNDYRRLTAAFQRLVKMPPRKYREFYSGRNSKSL